MTRKTPLSLPGLVLALGLGALLGGAALPARADDDWRRERREEWREREWREHERERHEWREHEWREWCLRHPGAYAYPGYYCSVPAPPPVVYVPATVPPPVVVAPPPSIEVVVPLRFK